MASLSDPKADASAEVMASRSVGDADVTSNITQPSGGYGIERLGRWIVRVLSDAT